MSWLTVSAIGRIRDILGIPVMSCYHTDFSIELKEKIIITWEESHFP